MERSLYLTRIRVSNVPSYIFALWTSFPLSEMPSLYLLHLTKSCFCQRFSSTPPPQGAFLEMHPHPYPLTLLHSLNTVSSLHHCPVTLMSPTPLAPPITCEFNEIENLVLFISISEQIVRVKKST